LHEWFPYIEGYSPQFVEQVLREFCPEATRVLDPFGGLGTTPLTAARLGCDAFYCELNPLLQFITTTKVEVLTSAQPKRLQLASSLRAFSRDGFELIKSSSPDEDLRRSHSVVFGDSRFFDNRTFESVLRARSAVDLLGCSDPLLSRLLTVAVLASLVPASLTIRRGDLRFKTSEERQRDDRSLLEVLNGRVNKMADDLDALGSIGRAPRLVAEDAKTLIHLEPLGIDAVLTSPPYLNGTNYFRNTKIELWFLRCLSTQEDLSEFRLRAVTAGINDVTKAKLSAAVPHQAAQVVDQLANKAYDARIPKMVASYFLEMQTIFLAIRGHLARNGSVLMDIGDSSYGNVHVATDRILISILKDLGFALRREVLLRKRMSRNGLALRQVLLVFDLKGASRTERNNWNEHSATWPKAWANFKKALPHQSATYAKRNWGHPLHSLCSYQGKMKPSLSYHLVKTFVPFGGTVLDPFAGVGTIPFEAALAGRKSWSFEISPAALTIAAAKLSSPNAEHVAVLLEELEQFLKHEQVSETEVSRAKQIRFNGTLQDYFAPRTFREVLLARRFFLKRLKPDSSEQLVRASLLHILHGNRPYALSRRSHPITPFAPTGPAEYRPLMPRLREKVARGLATPRGDLFVDGSVVFQDATGWWPRSVRDLDAVITSPPFFDSTRFHLANWMRLWFCGWEADDFREKPLAFVDERQKQGFSIYEPIFRQARERLRPGGVFVLHLGRSKKCDMLAELSKIARRWFRVADSFVEDVMHCESHGIRDKGSVSQHQFLVLQ
jgi:DNA modification methylase